MRNWLIGSALALGLIAPSWAQQYGQPVTPITPAQGSVILSNSITTGGTLQGIGCCTATTRSFEFENICNISGNCGALTDKCLLVWGSGSQTIKMVVPSGAYYGRFSGIVPSDSISVTCDTSADKFWAEMQ